MSNNHPAVRPVACVCICQCYEELPNPRVRVVTIKVFLGGFFLSKRSSNTEVVLFLFRQLCIRHSLLAAEGCAFLLIGSFLALTKRKRKLKKQIGRELSELLIR